MRRSFDTSTACQKNSRRKDGVKQILAKTKNGGISKTRKIRSNLVTETRTDVNVDENIVNKIVKIPILRRSNRRKLKTHGSALTLTNVSQNLTTKSNEVEEQITSTKVEKACIIFRPLQPVVPLHKLQFKNNPSSVVLPKGVTNIDPHDESCQIYGHDIFSYVLMRDAKFAVTSRQISANADAKIEVRRERLVDWLIYVAQEYKCSQETLYQTVDILDRCLSKAKFKKEYLQLLGITSFWIATKLDEYNPADIKDLCRLTDNSVTSAKILAMERKILEITNFQLYGTEPMTFICRFLKAGSNHFLDKTKFTYELSILLMDAMLLKLWKDTKDASTVKKAAVVVFTALMISHADLNDTKAAEKIWIPNMIHYVWPNYQDLIPMSKHILKKLKTIMEDSNNQFALTTKYKSVSRYFGLLQKLSYEHVIEVEAFIEKL